MAIKSQYFEAVDLVNELRGKVDDLLVEYSDVFTAEGKAEEIMFRVSNYKKSISHLEEMMEGIREEVGRATIMEWRREYKQK